MKKAIITLLLFPLCISALFCQEFDVTGVVEDENGLPMPGCHIHKGPECYITNRFGTFQFSSLISKAELNISFIGYETLDTTVALSNDTQLRIKLKPSMTVLKDISIVSNHKTTSRKTQQVSQAEILNQFTGTLAGSLKNLSGINSMDIGTGAAKPVIRGMAFSRVAVSENGIKQEGQQWGADHGLELDPFNVENITVIKGSAAIEYGSGAIGGILQINNKSIPQQNEQIIDFTSQYKSINNGVASSLLFSKGYEHFYFKSRASIFNTGDYKIPTDNIVYLTQIIPIYNKKVKNSASREYDISFQGGYHSETFLSKLSVTNVYQKGGFFPGSHGVPDVDRVLDDGNARNIEYPFQDVNHIKIISNTTRFFDHSTLYVDLSFQNNRRREKSEFHTHYANQMPPEEHPDLELDFSLTTYDCNVKWDKQLGIHNLSIGSQNQFKQNKIGGYNFFLPQYTALLNGLFIRNQVNINNKNSISGGIRYDMAKVSISEYFNSILYNYLISKNRSEADAQGYAYQAQSLDKTYNNVNWHLGFNSKLSDKLSLNMNAGSSYRTPTAIELGANGIHHGSIRHERGNPNLDSEKGIYSDFSLQYKSRWFTIETTPYLYYFSNYIYLNPSGEWSELPHAGQIYQYEQTKVLISGIELSFTANLSSKFELMANAELIYNRRISDITSKQYPLPFTPPANIFTELSYKLNKNNRFFINSKITSDQNRIAPNELSTDGSIIYGCGFNSTIKIKQQALRFRFQANNLLDNVYLNHLNFYRKLNMPEPGRNIQVILNIPITNKSE